MAEEPFVLFAKTVQTCIPKAVTLNALELYISPPTLVPGSNKLPPPGKVTLNVTLAIVPAVVTLAKQYAVEGTGNGEGSTVNELIVTTGGGAGPVGQVLLKSRKQRPLRLKEEHGLLRKIILILI